MDHSFQALIYDKLNTHTNTTIRIGLCPISLSFIHFSPLHCVSFLFLYCFVLLYSALLFVSFLIFSLLATSSVIWILIWTHCWCCCWSAVLVGNFRQELQVEENLSRNIKTSARKWLTPTVQLAVPLLFWVFVLSSLCVCCLLPSICRFLPSPRVRR